MQSVTCVSAGQLKLCTWEKTMRGALLSNWGHTMKHRSENLFRQMQTETCTIRRGGNGVSKP